MCKFWQVAFGCWIGSGLVVAVAASAGTVEIRVTDQQGALVPCRIHLINASGEPQRAGELPFWRDHFVCPGSVKLQLAAGTYTYEIERGPEFEQAAGTFSVLQSASARVRARLARIANLAPLGWYAGDLHIHRPIEQIELLMRAEDLHVGPVITWWNNRNLWSARELPGRRLVRFDGNRTYHVMAGEDEREGGALMFYNLNRPLNITGSEREYPSPMRFVAQARQNPNVWIDVEKPFWWDVPVWLASGEIDSIGLANNHMCRSRMFPSEAWGRPRDTQRLPPPHGNGFWSQEIYYHILNSGLRLPPSAGSASGVLPNPVGYNRVYVHLGDEFTYENWWRGLKQGRCFVTNGPLLLCRADGQLPGHVFTRQQTTELQLEITGSLKSRDPVSEVQIIKNGEVQRTVAACEFQRTGRLGTVRFAQSGWFLVRAIAENKRTFRFASTAPYYVEIDRKRRVSKRSVQFFLDWVDERIERVGLKLDDPKKLRDVLAHHHRAKRFWQHILSTANAP